MSTGGIFQLITNDGKQDRMLMATKLLNQRLLEIERVRSRNPAVKDPTPTLVDIERTHILFMNAHFKPFAAIGYEYNKVRVQSGSAALGQDVQFSIPQFGDFFNDMVLHLVLGAVTADDADNATRYLAYVNNLGERAVKNVKFTVNSNPLDEYNQEVHAMHNAYFVTPNKRWGWNELVGQENPHKGFKNSLAGRGSGVREQIEVVDGPQTPKVTQPEVDLWVPLLFWFNRDPRLSIPSVSIPYGQRFIDVTLARAGEILQHVGLNATDDAPGSNPPPVPAVLQAELYINNIFVNPEIHDIFIKRIGFSLIRVHRQQMFRESKATDNVLLQQLKWPTETIYLGLRPTDNISESSPKMLTCWDIYAKVDDNVLTGCAIKNGFYFLAQPASTTAANINLQLRSTIGLTLAIATNNPTVAQLNAEILADVPVQLQAGFPQYDPNLFVDPAAPTAAEIFNLAPPIWCSGTYQTCEPTIDELTVQAHGVPLYNRIPSKFFNSYTSYTYGGHHVNTPEDCGKMMIPFNLYPGSYQPSGHVNISRAREFYIEYVSSNVGSTVPQADLQVVAIAINFLLISDGSAVLRYST